MDDDCSYSLLDGPLVSVRRRDGKRVPLTLPDVLAGLARDDIVSFERLQAHQRQAWFCFLVQLAALALVRTGGGEPAAEGDEWRAGLLELTNGDEAPWCLVVDDVSRPAFMQSPVPEGSLEAAGYRADIEVPDDLDLLITAKNHDVKMQRIAQPRPEHWLYALVTLQTQEGFLGRGNYGVVRMNGGFGNRPLVGVAPGLSWGARFCRDLVVLTTVREHLALEHGYDLGGHALLWLPPWDGKKASGIPLRRCDPLFVEICRRIRFTQRDGRLSCLRANTGGTRVAAPDALNGVTGDPWTPVERTEAKALTVGGSGFNYKVIQRVSFSDDYARPAALEKTETERDGCFLIATALARGQGQTEGLHHRVVPIPSGVIKLFDAPSGRDKLFKRAQERVELASTAQGQILRPAVRCLLQAGGDGNVDGEKLRRWTDAFDDAVDDVFFEELWEAMDLPHEEARRRWQQRLLDLAQKQLANAVQASPLPSIRRYRAISEAEAVFGGQARRHFTLLFDEREETDREHVETA